MSGAIVPAASALLIRDEIGIRPLIWKTALGRFVAVRAMQTSHLFNAMKMCFNHLAEQHNGQPVLFTHKYRDFTARAVHDPGWLAVFVVGMLFELETRTDLPAFYVEPLRLIRAQVFGLTEPAQLPKATPALPAARPWEIRDESERRYWSEA